MDPICAELAKGPEWLHPTLMGVSFVIYTLIGYVTGRFVANRFLSFIIIALINLIFNRSKKTEQQQNKES